MYLGKNVKVVINRVRPSDDETTDSDSDSDIFSNMHEYRDLELKNPITVIKAYRAPKMADSGAVDANTDQIGRAHV